MIEIYTQGTPVVVANSGYAGQITEARIIGDQVLYLVAYFQNGAYEEKWFSDFQFTTEMDRESKVGFKA